MNGTHRTAVSEFAGKYIVWSPESSLPVNYVYDDRPTAIKVAYDMAAKYPQQRFLVMKAVGLAGTKKVEFTDLEAEKEKEKVREVRRLTEAWETQPRAGGKFAPRKDPLGADADAGRYSNLYAPGTK